MSLISSPMSANGVVPIFHQLTAFTITLLVALLPLRYQMQTPLAILPTTVLVAVSSIILYFLLSNILLLAPTNRFSAVAHHLLVLSAYVAVCSLAVANLPGWAAPFLYTIFALLFAALLYKHTLKDKIIQAYLEGYRQDWELSFEKDTRTRGGWFFVLVKNFYSCPNPMFEKLKANPLFDVKKEAAKDGGSGHIVAHTFTFHELATTAKNFSADCLLGEGGFGRIYKGRLESQEMLDHLNYSTEIRHKVLELNIVIL